jgi:hypothetical protein
VTRAGLVDAESVLDCTESCACFLRYCGIEMNELFGIDRDT